MSATEGSFDVAAFIDSQPIGRSQYVITLLCGLVMFLDGLDTQSISYAAPLIAKEWTLPHQMLGPIFSAALVGLMVGYLLVSPLSDRFGHRRMMIISTVAFGLFTALNAISTNVTEVLILRFLIGVGLGAAAPSAVALTSEYNPKRLRATCVLLIYCGFSLGFVAAGGLAAWLLPLFGWRALFWVGAAAPLCVSIFLISWLPESFYFLIRSGAAPQKVREVVSRLVPGALKLAEAKRFAAEGSEQGTAFHSLFTGNQGFGTIILWIVFFLNLAEFYALQSWLPSILGDLHYTLDMVALATSLTTIGGIVVAVVVGPAMDRIGPYPALAALYMLGVASVAFLGLAIYSPIWVLLIATFLVGVCVSGGQKSAIALAAVFYPPALRSTGVGWALGVGRLGGIAGPVVIGFLIGAGFKPNLIFYLAALPMLVCGTLVGVMGLSMGAYSLWSSDS
jgi:MFS transporter, AAHS family, 4-hydroxybenzoate transporter